MSVTVNVGVVIVIVVVLFFMFLALARDSDIHVAIKRGKILEGRLKRELGATGKGLSEKANSVKDKLPDKTFKQIDKIIVPERNKIAHEDDYNKLKSRRNFIKTCKSVESTLDKLRTPKPAHNNALGCVAVFFIIVLISYLLVQNPL